MTLSLQSCLLSRCTTGSRTVTQWSGNYLTKKSYMMNSTWILQPKRYFRLRLKPSVEAACTRRVGLSSGLTDSYRSVSRVGLGFALTGLSARSASTLRRLVTVMGVCVPCFPVAADKIEILSEPHQFYQTLKDEISSAKRRITWAALYLGVDQLEKQLIDCLLARMTSCPDLDLTVLLDHSRGTRGSINSCTLLQPLVEKFGRSRAHIALYHTPQLRGLLKSCLPERFSETVGLNHIKIFVFDDNVLISGANLSDSYFTNRQDRYMLIRDSPDLADFFHQLVTAVSTFSFEMKPGGKIDPHRKCPVHPYQDDDEIFKQEARNRLLDVIHNHLPLNQRTNFKSLSDADIRTMMENTSLLNIKNETESSKNGNSDTNETESSKNGNSDTYIYPLLQMGQLDVHYDQLVLETLLSQTPEKSRVHLASGYFNLTDEYVDIILHKSQAEYKILTASPQVNGFYGARGIAGYIPVAYTQVSKQFFTRVNQSNAQNRIKLYEYYRPKWTFHVKGLWYYAPEEVLPCLTLIGSPNYGYRSVHRDLEAQIAIVTSNGNLQKRLHQEQDRIYRLSEEVSQKTYDVPERYVPWWVRIVTKFIRTFF